MKTSHLKQFLNAIKNAIRGQLKTILCVSWFATTSAIWAQDSITTLQMHGKTFVCESSTGQRVSFYFSEAAVQVGGGAVATRKDGRDAITFSKTYMQGLSRQAAFFVAHHECAHLALPMGTGLGSPSQETNADCYAVAKMQNSGLLTSWSEFADAMTAIRNSSGSASGHLPGPERVKAAAACINMPIMRSDEPLCKAIDSIFAGGSNFLNFQNTHSIPGLPGFHCEANRSEKRMSCNRWFDSESDRISFENSFSTTMNACLPTEFIRRPKTHIFRVWANPQSKQSIASTGEDDRFSLDVSLGK